MIVLALLFIGLFVSVNLLMYKMYTVGFDHGWHDGRQLWIKQLEGNLDKYEAEGWWKE